MPRWANRMLGRPVKIVSSCQWIQVWCGSKISGSKMQNWWLKRQHPYCSFWFWCIFIVVIILGCLILLGRHSSQWCRTSGRCLRTDRFCQIWFCHHHINKEIKHLSSIVQAICLVVNHMNHIFAESLMIRPRFELNMTPTETESVNISQYQMKIFQLKCSCWNPDISSSGVFKVAILNGDAL